MKNSIRAFQSHYGIARKSDDLAYLKAIARDRTPEPFRHEPRFRGPVVPPVQLVKAVSRG